MTKVSDAFLVVHIFQILVPALVEEVEQLEVEVEVEVEKVK